MPRGTPRWMEDEARDAAANVERWVDQGECRRASREFERLVKFARRGSLRPHKLRARRALNKCER